MQPEDAAMKYALKLLTYRPRSVHELTVRLQKKQFSEEVVAETIARLIDWDYLNDEKFTDAWIQYRILNKPMGAIRLKQELREKGVPKEIINAKLEEAFSVNSEFDIARKLANSKLNRSKNWPQVARMLIRRGFSYDTVEAVRESLGIAADW